MLQLQQQSKPVDHEHPKDLEQDAQGGYESSDNENEPETDDRDDRDGEHGLLWDAQSALIHHHIDLAIKLYSQAALPPHRSVAACLALGNLLIRGSAFSSTQSSLSPLTSPSAYDDEQNGKAQLPIRHTESDQRTWSATFSRLFTRRSPPAVQPTNPPAQRPPLPESSSSGRRRTDLVSTGWMIPKSGKRAVRDVEGMGVAGAWFVLGLGWLVQQQEESESSASQRKRQYEHEGSQRTQRLPSDEEMLSFNARSRSRNTQSHTRSSSPSIADLRRNRGEASPSFASTASSGETLESSMIKTPGGDLVQGNNTGGTAATFDMMYELLLPLLHLYRNGHIQAYDPVALPPISINQLPLPLRPSNEREKGRNTWHLGGVVARRLLRSFYNDPMSHGSFDGSGRKSSVRTAVYAMGNYISAMTSADDQAEACFRKISTLTPTGLDPVDDLITQAFKRLNILTSTPRDKDEKGQNGFPFPVTPLSNNPAHARHGPQSSKRPMRVASMTALTWTITAPRGLSTPLKSAPSSASLTTVAEQEDLTAPEKQEESCAETTLRRIHARSSAHLASLSLSSLDPDEASTPEPEPEPEPENVSHPSEATTIQASQTQQHHHHDESQTARPRRLSSPTPTRHLRPVASSPQFSTLHSASQTTDRRRLPFEPAEAVAPIDPELAKAELASTLTKHVTCGVCGMQGVNFPECRKCGLTFCSRGCRVDENKAGNGKKHVCGLWEVRRPSKLGIGTNKIPVVQPMPLSPGQYTRVC